MLVYHQRGDKRSYEDNFLMKLDTEQIEKEPVTSESKSDDYSDESEDSSKEEELKKEEPEEQKNDVRLPMIKKKYPNLSIGTSDYFNNKIEVDFNNKYAEILKENEVQYLRK